MCKLNTASIQDGEVLIIVPPETLPDTPSLAAHVLQACARAAGFRVSILYANMMLASTLGIQNYMTISNVPKRALLWERLFAASAYPPLQY